MYPNFVILSSIISFLLQFVLNGAVKFEKVSTAGNVSCNARVQYVPAVPFNDLPIAKPLNMVYCSRRQEEPQTSSTSAGVGKTLRRNQQKSENFPWPPPNFTKYVEVEDPNTNAHTADQYFDAKGNCWQHDFSDGMYIYIAADQNEREYAELTAVEYQARMEEASRVGSTLRRQGNSSGDKIGTTLRRSAPQQQDTPISGTLRRVPAEQAQGPTLRRKGHHSSQNELVGPTLRKTHQSGSYNAAETSQTLLYFEQSIQEGSDESDDGDDQQQGYKNYQQDYSNLPHRSVLLIDSGNHIPDPLAHGIASHLFNPFPDRPYRPPHH